MAAKPNAAYPSITAGAGAFQNRRESLAFTYGVEGEELMGRGLVKPDAEGEIRMQVSKIDFS